MTPRFFIAAIVGLTLFVSGAHMTLAQSTDNGKMEKIRSNVQKRLRNGKTDVKVERLDGTKIKGKITQANDTDLTIVESKTNQSRVIAYSDTKSIEGSGGWPTSAKIAIGLAAAAVITFVAVGIAFKNADRITP
ncbi:MAG: hypothetical protein ABIO91_04325 [Pyrinomonadaceae bacterium]